MLLQKAEPLSRPVGLARALMEHGVSLRKAHEALDRLAAGQSYAIEVGAADVDSLIAASRPLGVDAALLRKPMVDAKKVRGLFKLSQQDFARRFGLEVRTVQNWEQNRYGLDAPALILLAMIRDHPEAVEAVLTGPPPPHPSV